MITEKGYLEAQMIVKLYESQQSNIFTNDNSSCKVIPKPPEPPKNIYRREGQRLLT